MGSRLALHERSWSTKTRSRAPRRRCSRAKPEISPATGTFSATPGDLVHLHGAVVICERSAAALRGVTTSARSLLRWPVTMPLEDQRAMHAENIPITPTYTPAVCEHARTHDDVRAVMYVGSRCRVLHEGTSTRELRNEITAMVPDAVFLDIRFLGADGIVLAGVLRRLNPRPLVVFTTGFESRAVSTLEVHAEVQAMERLLKPLDDRRLQVALRRIERALALAVPEPPGGEEPGGNRPGPSTRRGFMQRLVIRSVGRIQIVEVAQIDWLCASGNYVEIHANQQSLLHRERLHVLEQQLDPAAFVRIHRSTIVRRAAVKELQPLAGGDYRVVLRDGAPLRLSRTYHAAVADLRRDR